MKKISFGLLAASAPSAAFACACGCGVFDVATSSMFPQGTGPTAYTTYAFQDQSRNWSGASQASANNNDDKNITTDFFGVGLQYMANASWGVQAELPFAYRYFRTTDGAGNIASTAWGSLGDLRLKGLYTGFFADQSAGINFGVKLPTGDDNYNPSLVDRDSQIGTGSTDLLLGGYWRGNLDANQNWDWFAQSELDVPTLIQAQYRPGVELNSAAGVDYKGFTVGRARISPVAQAIFSLRGHDSGDAADYDNSGYARLLLSPGVELHLHPVKFYADVELPVFQNVNGNQLVAPVLFKAGLSYMF